MPELLNPRKELYARRYVQCLDSHEALRLAGLLPEPPTDDSTEAQRLYDNKVKQRIQYYSHDIQVVTRIAELQANDPEIHISKQQLIAARLALANAAMQGDDRYGYNAKLGQFEPTGERIRDYKAADSALAGVAKMLGMDQQASDDKGLVVVLPGALLESEPVRNSGDDITDVQQLQDGD